jgi:hypothetical protein
MTAERSRESGDWPSGWAVTAAIVAAVTVVGPLVLGALVALEDRPDGWPVWPGADGDEE